MVISTVVQIGVLASCWFWIEHGPVHDELDVQTVELSLVELPPPPKPDQQVKPEQPKPLTPAPPQLIHLHLRPLAALRPPSAAFAMTDIPPAPPLPAQHPATANPDAVATFEGRLRQAVQDAMVYPPAAKMMKQQGRAKVGFTYLDGAASGIRLIQSSGVPSLDDAALAAARAAGFPPPPSELQHRSLPCLIWIEFNLSPGY